MSAQDRSSEAQGEATAAPIALADIFDSAQEDTMKKAARHYKKHLASDVQKEIVDNELSTGPLKKKWKTELKTKGEYASANLDSLQGIVELSSAWLEFRKDKAKIAIYAEEEKLKEKRAALKTAVEEMTKVAQEIATLQEEVSEHEAARLEAQEALWSEYRHKAAKYEGYLKAIRKPDQPPAPADTPSEPEERPASPPPDKPKPERKRRTRPRKPATVEDASD